jgi:hypothetical protein
MDALDLTRGQSADCSGKGKVVAAGNRSVKFRSRSRSHFAPDKAAVPQRGMRAVYRRGFAHYALGREDHNDLGAFVTLGSQGEGSAVQFGEAPCDGKTEA